MIDRLALPSGRLLARSLGVMEALGFPTATIGRRYVVRHAVVPLEVVLLKIQDIPRALSTGLVSMAVASDEWLLEAETCYDLSVPLCWYHVSLDLLAPQDQVPQVGTSPTIATSYPSTTARILAGRGDVRVLPVAGAVEAYPGVFTDYAVDCVESGRTASANGLVRREELARCDVRYIRRGPLATPTALWVEETVCATAPDPECQWARLSCDRQAVLT